MQCNHLVAPVSMHGIPQATLGHPGPRAPLLQGPLLSAAVSADACLLLLVAAHGTVLLQRTSPLDADAAFDQALFSGNPLAEGQGGGGLPAGAVEGTLPGSFTFAGTPGALAVMLGLVPGWC